MKKILITALIALVFFSFLAIASQPEKEDRGPLEKITFIHYKKGTNEASIAAKTKPSKIACYGFLSAGAKWKTTENFVVNPANNDGLSEAFVQDSVNAGVAEWEKSGGNIFGTGTISYSAAYNSNLDGINTVTFGDLGNQGIIAMTTVWGYFSGPTKSREIVEWDLQFNDYFQYGDATLNPLAMDLQNIATHELGHSAGMADLYTVSCNAETMYGYSSVGETQKRTLNTGDVKGIKLLYGA